MTIPIINVNGQRYLVVDGPSITNNGDGTVKYALTMDKLNGIVNRGQLSMLSQFYGLVYPGMVLSAHLFKGLNRNLYCDEAFNGDEDKYVFSRKPTNDFYWQGGKSGQESRTKAPEKQVFAVLVSVNNKHQANFPDVAGWIEHWTWIDEDPVLSKAPNEWVDRYDEKIWSK